MSDKECLDYNAVHNLMSEQRKIREGISEKDIDFCEIKTNISTETCKSLKDKTTQIIDIDKVLAGVSEKEYC